MKRLSILLGFCLIVAMLPTFVPQPVASMTGSGTVGDPYVIWNCTDLQSITSSYYYELGQDIDCSCTQTWNWNAGRGVYEGFAPVSFTGHLDGKHYRITDLYINRAYTGTSAATVGLITAATGATVVANVSLVGVNFTVNKTGTSGAPMVGALLGLNLGGTVERCYSSGTITVTWAASNLVHGVGGLVGKTEFTGAVITQSCSEVDVSCTGASYDNVSVGGLVGYHGGGSITNCYARGDVYGYGNSLYSNVGGLIGRIYTANVHRSYSTGDVSGNGRLGGLVGSTYSSTWSYSYWDILTSGMATSALGYGRDTSQMKTQATYVTWDFTSIWSISPTINAGYPYFLWWYNPPDVIQDVNQVVWFQPNTIIEGTELPNRAQSGTLIDGEFHWGANPAGITISYGELIPEEEYDFAPITPSTEDIIKPAPESMTTDVDTAGLVNNPLYPMVAALGALPGLNERLVWLGLAWLVVIAAMLLTHLGANRKKGEEAPQHFVLTTIVGLGLSIFFYVIGIFPLWVVILMALGLVGAIIYERQPVL